MITVNTNQASMLVRKNFRNSTNSLNTAIERLTTGYRINSAKDDAVGKAVSIDMDVKLSSNEVVQNNVEMGVSLLNTAEGNLNLIKDKVQRCRNLCEQALNGTYDSSSQNAIKAELNQLVAQINQIKETSEFNGITLFDSSGGGHSGINAASGGSSGSLSILSTGFMSEILTQNATTVIDSNTSNVSVAEANLRTALASNGTIGISSATGLQALANVVNGTNGDALDCAGKTIVLTQDINLGSISNWTPIGATEETYFNGTFNGNGHTISNVNVTSDYAGLFGLTSGIIMNTGVVNVNASGFISGGLVVGILGGSISNCYTTGNVSLMGYYGGGLVGAIMNGSVENSYTKCSVSGMGGVIGGLVGAGMGAVISNSGAYNYVGATGEISGVGSFIGYIEGDVSFNNCEYYDSSNNDVGLCSGMAVQMIDISEVSLQNILPPSNNTGFMSSVVTKSADTLLQSSGFLSFMTTQNATTIIDSNASTVDEAVTALTSALEISGAVIGISNKLGLQALSQIVNAGETCYGKTIVLTQDIDLGSIDNWTPIGNNSGGADYTYAFQGIFNGNGHTVSNMKVSGEMGSGLFGNIYRSTISNTGVVNATVSGTYGVAVLIGGAYMSSINNSYAIGSVSGTMEIGGLVGSVQRSNITNSYAVGSVSGNMDVGGLIGLSYSCAINNSKAYTLVSGSASSIGSFIGHSYNSSNSYTNNTYLDNSHNAIGDVSGSVSGVNYNSSVSLPTTSTTVVASVGGSSVSDAVTTIDNYIIAGATSIDLTNAVALQALAQYVNSGHNCAGISFNLTDNVNLSSVANWTPIGNDMTTFQGNFNGNGHTISNLKCSGTYNLGLFGLVHHATISNTAVINASISGTDSAIGGLVGYIYNSAITNSYVTGNIYSSSERWTGGLIGTAQVCSVSNSYAHANVSGQNYVGGLIGHTENTSVTNSYATGTVSGTEYVGGLLGSANWNSSVTNSYASGKVTGETSVGGFVGETTEATINSSTAYTTVNGNNYVGGFVGVSSSSSPTQYSNCRYTDSSLHPNGNYVSGVSAYEGITHVNVIPTRQSAIQEPTPEETPAVPIRTGFTIQIGFDGSDNSSITFDFGFSIDSLNSIAMMPNQRMNLSTIDSVLSEITSVETQIGAGLNRLESVQESLQTQHKTLTAARSIVKDADVSQESARYIRSQILQQASASLLTVANQSPSLMLSLINGMTR